MTVVGTASLLILVTYGSAPRETSILFGTAIAAGGPPALDRGARSDLLVTGATATC